MKQPGRWTRIRRAIAFLRPERATVGGIVGLALVVAVASALDPLVLKHIIDELSGQRRLPSLALCIGAIVLLSVVKEGANALKSWLSVRTQSSVHRSLFEATVNRLQDLPLSFHRQQSAGAITKRLDRGTRVFLGAVGEIAFNVVPSVAYLAIAVGVMWHLDWRLALTVIGFSPLLGLIARWAAPAQTRRERQLLDRLVRVHARFHEVLTRIVAVKTFATERREKDRLLAYVDDANHVATRGVGFDSSVGAAQNLVVMAARVAAVAVGGVLVLHGQISVGTLVAFLGYVGGLFNPVQTLSGVYRTLRTASVSLDEIFTLLDTEDFLEDRPDAIELRDVRGDVEFDEVSFTYHGGQRPLLDRMCLKVKAGERVAIVGPSGAGKSTVMSLLQRLDDPQCGCIRIDGIDLREVSQQSLRQQIGVVLEDNVVFNETVRSNIAYGRPDASMEEIEAAARTANAHEFITRLPNGYDTFVGEHGSRLSRGERQRISIARSLVRDPAILILDEPTVALDAESEASVQEALGELSRGRTTFAIAHKLSTVADADRIVVLNKGRIAETGSHTELMDRNGYYASLVRQQAREPAEVR